MGERNTDTDTLVKRLRDGCNLQQRDGERAADRIEALEAEVARLRKVEASYDTAVQIAAMESREVAALASHDKRKEGRK